MKTAIALAVSLVVSTAALARIQLERIKLPPGFQIEVFAEGVKNARSMTLGEAGTLFVSTRTAGNVYAIKHDGKKATLAMAACGVVCLQEFGAYDDWRIPKNMDVILTAIQRLKPHREDGRVPFDAYTLYYVGQAIYQVGGKYWQDGYPRLRDMLVASQKDGCWKDGNRVQGKPGDLYGTAVACFILSIPNRYLPILQEGKIDSLRGRFEEK